MGNKDRIMTECLNVQKSRIQGKQTVFAAAK